MQNWRVWYSTSDLYGMAATLGYEMCSDHGWDLYARDPRDPGRRIAPPVLVREWEGRLRAVFRCDVARFRVGKLMAGDRAARARFLARTEHGQGTDRETP